MKPRQRILVAHDESTFNSTRLWKKSLGTNFSHLDRTLMHGTGREEYWTSQISQPINTAIPIFEKGNPSHVDAFAFDTVSGHAGSALVGIRMNLLGGSSLGCETRSSLRAPPQLSTRYLSRTILQFVAARRPWLAGYPTTRLSSQKGCRESHRSMVCGLMDSALGSQG